MDKTDIRNVKMYVGFYPKYTWDFVTVSIPLNTKEEDIYSASINEVLKMNIPQVESISVWERESIDTGEFDGQ